MFFRSSVHGLAALTCFQTLLNSADAAATDFFKVKLTGKGSCAGLPYEDWFADAKTLAAAAVAGTTATEDDSQEYLTTWFSIGPKDNAQKGEDVAKLINDVSAALETKGQVPGGKPWLFCSSEWAEGKSFFSLPKSRFRLTSLSPEKKWDDIAQKKTDGLPYKGSKKIQDVYKHEISDGVVPFWSDDLKQYFFSVPGDYCTDRPDDAAVTQDLTKPSTISICVKNFKKEQGSALVNVPDVTETGVSVNDRMVHSLTLYHELYHLVHGTFNTPDFPVKEFADYPKIPAANAAVNPESYTLYSFSYWLSHKFTDYTFKDTTSQKRTKDKDEKDEKDEEAGPSKRWADKLVKSRSMPPQGRRSWKL